MSCNIKFMLGKVLMHVLPACFAGLEIAMLSMQCSGNDSCIIASFKETFSPVGDASVVMIAEQALLAGHLYIRYDICAKID